MNNLMLRARLFVVMGEKHVLLIKDPLGDGQNYWFVVNDFRWVNPGSHIYVNEVKGKNITHLMLSNEEFSKDSFLTKLDNVELQVLRFPDSIGWFKVE